MLADRCGRLLLAVAARTWGCGAGGLAVGGMMKILNHPLKQQKMGGRLPNWSCERVPSAKHQGINMQTLTDQTHEATDSAKPSPPKASRQQTHVLQGPLKGKRHPWPLLQERNRRAEQQHQAKSCVGPHHKFSSGIAQVGQGHHHRRGQTTSLLPQRRARCSALCLVPILRDPDHMSSSCVSLTTVHNTHHSAALQRVYDI